MRDLVLDTPPATRLIPIDQARAHVGSRGWDDPLLEDLALTAEQYLDGHSGVLGRALITQSWILHLDQFPCGRTIRLPLPPLQTVDEVGYVDGDGVDQVLDAGAYQVLTGERSELRLLPSAAWPATACQARAVAISFTCGYGPTASDVGRPIVAAAKLILGDLWSNRESQWAGPGSMSVTSNPTLDRLLRPYRVPRI